MRGLEPRNTLRSKPTSSSTPAIEYLRLGGPSLVSTLAELEHPPQYLHTLRLTTGTFNADQLIKALRPLLNIHTLEISNTPSAIGDVVDAMTSEGWCPLLEHLDLHASYSLTGSPLIRLVKARLPSPSSDQALPNAKLKLALILDDCETVDPSHVDWLRTKVSRVSYLFKKRPRY